MYRRAISIGFVVLVACAAAQAQTPAGTAFTYQGQLKQSGKLVAGATDMVYKLFDADVGGNQIGATLTFDGLGGHPPPVQVTAGLFTVELDFGASAFTGDARWLDIQVRSPSGGGAYVQLTPRQELTAAPYALYALNSPSGGNADTVDTFHANATPTPNVLLPLNSSTKFPNSVLNTGSGGGLDSDLLDAQHGAFYQNASNLNAGTLASARLSGTYSNALTFSNGGNVFTGNGAGLSTLNASNIASGTLPDARLSSNVALLNNAQTFSGAKTFSAAAAFSVPAAFTQASGTAPFTVASNTLVSNLNADFLDGQAGAFYQNAGNLNAGTLPDARLAGTYSSALTLSNAGNTLAGSGASLTGLNASNVAYGTLADARLSTNVAMLNRVQTFTSNNSFTGRIGIGTTSPHCSLDVTISDVNHLIYAENLAANCTYPAVFGRNSTTDGVGIGVEGLGGQRGVYGYVNATGSGTYYGLYGLANNGTGGTKYGLYAAANGAGTNYAGYFDGDVRVNGTLSKSGGSFQIDHPLDPANKYLSHSFVESPDMMNIYNGNVVTGRDGYAEIQLPEWFEALNRDFRYQLTVIGQFAQAIVAEKIEGNRFAIRTDKPNVEVSWQVTGIRHDPWAEVNRIQVERIKPERERGSYLHPELYGYGPDRSLANWIDPELSHGEAPPAADDQPAELMGQ